MSPGVDFGSSVRRLPTRWVALRKSGAFRHGEPQRVGLDGASAPTPHALEDQPLAKQPSSSRADEPHGLLAAQARQGRGVIGIHKCQPATTATVPGSPTGWIWVLAGFGENPAGVPAFSHAPRFGFGAPIIGALEHPVDWRVSFEAEDAKSIPGHGP